MQQYMRDNLAAIEVKALFPQVLIAQEGVMLDDLWLPGLSTQGFSIVKAWTGRATASCQHQWLAWGQDCIRYNW